MFKYIYININILDLFLISQLQQFSGIKAHTLRMWEQRYNALTPNRSEGNTRYYDNTQLRRLLNIVSLMEMGHKVSKLSSMSDEELFALLDEVLKNNTSVDDPIEYFIAQLIAAGLTYDESHFDKLLSHCLLRFGMKGSYVKVIYPMLVRVGLMWTTDEMPQTQEHFISNLIRQKLFSAIDSLPPAKSVSNSWLLFLPENEFHEIGLLFANYLIRQAGYKVIYLGSNVSYETLINAVQEIDPLNLLFFLVHYDFPQDSQEYLAKLTEKFKHQNIYLSGNVKLISQLTITNNIKWIRSVDDLEEQLQ